jgi:predicted outer membrane repeat protein
MYTKKIILWLFCTLNLVVGWTLNATIRIVDITGHPAGSYTSINAAYAVTSTGDTILLTAGQTFTGPNNTNLTFAYDLTLGRTGSGANPIIDMQNTADTRFCIIDSGKTVTMSNLVIQNGNESGNFGGAIQNGGTLNATSCTFSNNTAYYNGGAIESVGTLNLTSCTFSNNTATHGGAGAIESAGTLNLTSCTFSNNTATRGGAGAIESTGTLNATSCIFNNNTAFNDGGALYNYSGPAIITCSRFVGNRAGSGSAIYIYGGSVTATSCWWDTNDDPRTVDNLFFGTVTCTPWIQMSLTVAQPSSGLVDLIATFSPACIPDGTPVAFTITSGTVTPEEGTTLNSTVTAQAYDFTGTQSVCAIAEPDSSTPVKLCATVQGSLQPLAPADVQAKQQIQRFPRYGDIVNTITWQAAQGTAPAAAYYVIYAAQDLSIPISTISADAPLRFVAHQQQPNVSYTYYLYAVSAQGVYSEPVEVTLP